MEILVEYTLAIMKILFLLVAAKALIIGSDFSFYKSIKYGDRYITWYQNRKEFNPDEIY